MNGRQPLVSVITIFLNEERFLEDAIRSVFAQTYDSWELLLVDDGSTDASSALARGWADQYPGRVRYLEHPGHENLGMSATRNLGFREARGELIALLDGDDVYGPGKLATQVAQLEEHPEAAMVYDSTVMWHTWGEAGGREPDRLRLLGVPPGTVVPPPRLLVAALRIEAETPGTCSLLVRREAFQNVGGFEASFRGMYEDQAFLAKVFLSYPVFVAGGTTAYYRQHGASACHVAEVGGEFHRGRPHRARQLFLEWLERYVAARGRVDGELRPALRQALRDYRPSFRDRFKRRFDRAVTGPVSLAGRRLRRLLGRDEAGPRA
jgi:glycosyltransferase involved in cell wall biosynthesis